MAQIRNSLAYPYKVLIVSLAGWDPQTHHDDLESYMLNMAKPPSNLCQEGDGNLYLVISWKSVTQGIWQQLTFPTRASLYLLLNKVLEIAEAWD